MSISPAIRKSLMAACLIGLSCLCFSREYYVCSKTGDNKNDGSKEKPWKDPSYAAPKLQAGDTLIFREGRYHDAIGPNKVDVAKTERVRKRGGKRTFFKGTANVGKWQDPQNPVTFRAAEGEKVIFDGTVAINDIADGSWELHDAKGDGKGIWKIKLKQDVWQLFDEGEIQTSARWPNAFWHDGSIWDQNRWASFGDNTIVKNREYIDGDTKNFPHSDLAKAGFDATGAMIIMNIANFDNYCEVVTEHGKGNERFKTTFNKNGGIQHMPIMRGPDRKNGKMTRRFQKGEGRLMPIFNLFFLECSLALLDAPTEWHYDKESKTLYYYPMDGKSPERRDVRGKVQSYAFDMMRARGVTIKGLNFFGTTVRFRGMGRTGKCDYITIEDCNFRYPSYSRRMLGERTSAQVTELAWNQPRHLTDWWGERHFTVRNCTFYRTDGVGIRMVGLKNRLENCYFKEIDYAAVDPISGDGGRQMTFRGNDDTIQVRQSPDIQVHRVTVDTAGAAHTIPTGANCSGRFKVRGNKKTDPSKVSYCRVIRGGLMQVQDGGNFHIWQFDSDYGTFDHCWANETTKWAFRFDGSFAPDPNAFHFNTRLDHCRASYCVAWDTWQDKVFTGKNFTRYGSGNFILKGDWHYIYNNLSFDGGQVELYIRSEDGGNKRSQVFNNLGTRITGQRRAFKASPFNGVQGNNWGDKDKVNVRELLRDPDNLDFRPKASSTMLIDKGKAIENVTTDVVGNAPDIGPYEYGCKVYWIPGYKAPGASTPIPPKNTKTAKPDLDLMWLTGYQAKSHTVYFGETTDALTKVKSFEGDYNICPTGQTLTPGKTYYWRVDTVDRFGKELKGETWSFTVKAATAEQATKDKAIK